MRARPVPIKKAYVWDWDDTLVQTDAKVQVYDQSGKHLFSLNPHEYSSFKPEFFHELDFSEFNDPYFIKHATPYKMFPLLKKINNSIFDDQLYILTGRHARLKIAIFNFLQEHGINNIELENIICVGSAFRKINLAKEKLKVLNQLKDEYDQIYFYDDDVNNITYANQIENVESKLIEKLIYNKSTIK